MALSTYSVFYFGIEVTGSTKWLDLSEGGPEINIEFTPKSYSLSELANELSTKLNTDGSLDYTVTVDRNARLLTISASGSFEFLFNTGTNSANSIASVLGFSATDTGSSTAHTSSNPIGSVYEPQFILQDFVDKNQNEFLIDANVNRAADGTVETVKFGSERFFEMSFKFINQGILKGNPFIYNATGLDDANNFFSNIINKVTFEFMPDKNNRNNFTKVILESTRESRDGTAYKLDELVSQSLPNIYEINQIRLRVVT